MNIWKISFLFPLIFNLQHACIKSYHYEGAAGVWLYIHYRFFKMKFTLSSGESRGTLTIGDPKDS